MTNMSTAYRCDDVAISLPPSNNSVVSATRWGDNKHTHLYI